MPVIPRWKGDENPMVLPPVAQFSSAQEAALHLWHALEALAAQHGGTAEIIRPRGFEAIWGTRWAVGPEGWADAYAAQEHTFTPTFRCIPEDGDTIMFSEEDE